MLDDICPVQFVEGLNENEESNTVNVANIASYHSVAIKYKPNLSYTLAELEILTLTNKEMGPREFSLNLCLDYSNKPSDLSMAEGKLAVNLHMESPVNVLSDWQRVPFNRKAVVIKDRVYWIVLFTDGKPLGLVTAVGGQVTPIMT